MRILFSVRRVGFALLAAISLLQIPAQAEDAIRTSPSPLTGLWWNADESGWGASITQHGAMIFLAWYTYDSARNPTWYVIPSCPIVGNACTGDLYSVSGGAPLSAPWGGPPAPTRVGSGTLAFTDNHTGTFSYVVDGMAGTRAITRQRIAIGTVPPTTDHSDLWYNPDEPGWGAAITQQYGVIFATFYSYTPNGAPTWFVAPNCPVSGDGCTSGLYEVHGGTPPTMPWAGQDRVVSPVGTIELSFSSADTATMRYTIAGVASQREIVRQAFGGRAGPAVAHSDVFDAFRVETGGSFCSANAHTITDGAGVPTAAVYYDPEEVPTREQVQGMVLSAGGRIDSSTPTEFCFTADGESACIRQVGNALVTEYRTALATGVQIYLTGLLPGHFSDVFFDSDVASAMIAAAHRAPCATGASPPANAINGNWYGYGFRYSAATRSGASTLATMSCANLTCSLLGDTGATFALSASPSRYWRTAPGAARLAGAEISSDLQLLTMYLCINPLDEARTLDQCGFYTFRRDGAS